MWLRGTVSNEGIVSDVVKSSFRVSNKPALELSINDLATIQRAGAHHRRCAREGNHIANMHYGHR